MADKKKEYELALKIAGLVDSSLGSACRLTKKQLREIAKEAAKAPKQYSDGVAGVIQRMSDSMSQAAVSWEKAGPGIEAAWGGVKGAAEGTATALAAAGAATLAVGTASIGVGKEFESAMSSWAATADASMEDYARARDAAMEMGRSTSKTATESAQALEYMALAGWSVEDSISGLPSVLRLSEATGLDLARTSDLVTDSMSALGVEVSGLGEYLDIAAKANNKSNQTAEQLMEAYLGVGGTLKNLNIPIQESAAALGVMANRGIKGSEAGNALNAVMVNLTTGTGQAGKMMGRLGISAFDVNGNFIGLKETLHVLNDSIAGLTEEEQNAALAAIGGKQHVDALNDLLAGMNTIVGDGVSEWDKLEQELYGAQGALERMAGTKLDNLQGDLDIFQSALSDTGIRIYDNLQDPLREAVQLGTGLVYEFSGSLVEGIGNALPTIKRELGDVKEAVQDFAEPLLFVGGWMLENPDVIAGGLAAIGTTITTLKIVKTVTDTASSFSALGAALMGNPITAAVSLAALAGGAIVGVSTQVKMANTELKKQNLAAHFGDISLSLSDLEDVAAQLIDNGSLGKLGVAMDELEKVREIAKGLASSQDVLEKLNWKVTMGFELSEAERSEYGLQIDSFIQDAIALGEQQQYAMNLNLQLLTDEGSSGQEVIDQFNSFYDSMNAQLRDYGEQLGEVYAEGMKDGVLSLDEVEAIQGLQEKMAEITAKLSASRFEAEMETIGIRYSGGQLDAETFQNLQAEIQAQVETASANLEESLTMNIAGAKLQLEEGVIDVSEYEAMIAQFKENYLEQVGEIQVKASSFQLDTLYQQYSEEIEAAMPELEQKLSGAISEAFQGMEYSDNLKETYGDYFSGMLTAGLEGITLSDDTQMAIGELLKNMAPSIEQMEEVKSQYEEAGKEIPSALSKALTEAQTLEMLNGDADAIWQYIGGQIRDSSQYQETYNRVIELGGTLPPAISEGMKEQEKKVEPGIDDLYNHILRYSNQKFSTPIPINPKIQVNYAAAMPYTVSERITKHAEGGIFDEPHYGVFGEAGPEAFIPIDQSSRSASIWEQTGKELGLLGNSATNAMNTDNSQSKIVYSPVYHITGASEETVRAATADDYDRFVSFYERYQKEQRRLAF